MNVPFDVISTRILSVCTVKDHLRWKRVCKQWYNYFKKMYLDPMCIGIWNFKLNGDSMLYGIFSQSKFTPDDAHVIWIYANITFYQAESRCMRSMGIYNSGRENYKVVSEKLPSGHQVLDICEVHKSPYRRYIYNGIRLYQRTCTFCKREKKNNNQ